MFPHSSENQWPCLFVFDPEARVYSVQPKNNPLLGEERRTTKGTPDGGKNRKKRGGGKGRSLLPARWLACSPPKKEKVCFQRDGESSEMEDPNQLVSLSKVSLNTTQVKQHSDAEEQVQRLLDQAA